VGKTRPLMQLQRCERGIAALEFALLAPALLMLAFAIIVYSLYFSAYMGVRQAAAEGARSAMAGLSSVEREALALERADEVIARYGELLGGQDGPEVTAGPIATGVFEVRVTYDMSEHPIMQFGGFIPLPDTNISSAVVITNGSY